MYSVTNEYRAAINKPDRVIKSRITLGDLLLDDTNIQGINLTGGIVAGNDFEIGTSIMSLIDIELIDLDYTLSAVNFENKELKAEIAIQLEDTTFEYVPLGLFTIENCEKSDRKIKLSGCDRMYKFEKDYISTLTYPVTLLNIAKEICSLAGVELLNTSFPNSNVLVNSMPVLDKVTLRKVISQISELAGGYCRITRDGKLEIFNLTVNSNSVRNYVTADGFTMNDYDPIADELIAGVIEVNRDNYISLTNKDLTFATVDKVIVKLGAEEATKGFGENPYYIVDNIFCQNPNLFIDNLYSALNGLSYMPFNSKWQGNMAIDCGDMISINTGRGIFNTIATNKKLTYRGGLREDYVAVAKSNTEKSSSTKGSLTLEMEKAKTEIKVLDGEISQRVKQADFESYTKQTAEEISSKVSNLDFQSYQKQTAQEISSKVSNDTFTTYKTQTAKEISSKVGDSDFQSYQSQTAEEISSKVSKGDGLKTEVTQNAESWGISINGKLKGTKYDFTGDSFTIGDLAGGDKVEHKPLYSKWMHGNDYSCASSEGFKRYIGATGKDYHYLFYVGSTNITAGTPVTITLPTEFKGKDFKVIAAVSALSLSGDVCVYYSVVPYITSIADGTFSLALYCTSITYYLNYIASYFLDRSIYTTGSATVSYTVIA